jgi:tRNA 2-thiouridine synthesizing protein C
MNLTWEDEEADWVEKPSIRVVSRAQLSDLLEQQDVILNF